MESVPATTFQKTLGEFLQRASRGELILVTQYGRPYALLGPPPAPEPEPDEASPTPKKRAARKRVAGGRA